MQGFPREKKCVICGKKFIAINPRHIYCGDRKQKTGCSYKKYLAYYKSEKHRLWRKKWEKSAKRRKWDRERKQKQRLLNTDYAKRQRESRNRYYKRNKAKIKKLNKRWRDRNLERILFNNKKRRLKLVGVIGSHTQREWEELKRKHGYCCARCGISEDELKIKWKGTNFTKLTEDHIIPLEKGGPDWINNIQPLCITCNTQKKDKIEEKLIYAYVCADFFHIGHLIFLEKAKKQGGILIVGVLSESAILEKKSKPIISYKERASLAEAFKCVDGVIKQDVYSPLPNVKKLRPDILIESESHDEMPANEFVESYGGKVVILPYYKGQSSSKIKEIIRGKS